MTRKHANRTCHFCGLRAPQPEMRRAEIFAESGRSRSSVSGGTIIGAALGNKSATRSITRSIFNTGQRTYLRKREVWICDGADCGAQAQAAARQSRKNQGMPVWVGVLIAIVLFLVIFGGGAAPQ
jgi:hypothetical protein